MHLFQKLDFVNFKPTCILLWFTELASRNVAFLLFSYCSDSDKYWLISFEIIKTKIGFLKSNQNAAV